MFGIRALSTRIAGWFRGTRNVLCIGATHLDTLATDSREGVAESTIGGIELITHPGKIVHAMGGSAFNVAVSLVREDRDRRLHVRFFTVLPKFSPLTQVFYRKMRE